MTTPVFEILESLENETKRKHRGLPKSKTKHHNPRWNLQKTKLHVKRRVRQTKPQLRPLRATKQTTGKKCLTVTKRHRKKA